MLTLLRQTRNFTTLICAMCIFVYACFAETLSSYSGQYTTDLEQKQMLLESIKEDAYKAENEMRESINKTGATEKKDYSSLEVGAIGLAKLMPPAGKINIAFTGMSGTLSPQHNEDHFPQDSDTSRN